MSEDVPRYPHNRFEPVRPYTEEPTEDVEEMAIRLMREFDLLNKAYLNLHKHMCEWDKWKAPMFRGSASYIQCKHFRYVLQMHHDLTLRPTVSNSFWPNPLLMAPSSILDTS